MSKQGKPRFCRRCGKTGVYVDANKLCDKCGRQALFSKTGLEECSQCKRSLPSANVTSIGICVRCMKDNSSKKQQPTTHPGNQKKLSVFDSVVGSITGLFSNNTTQHNNNKNNITNANTSTNNHTNRITNTSRNTTHVPTSTNIKSPTPSYIARRNTSPVLPNSKFEREGHDPRLKMCMECGTVCTNIPPGRDTCNDCNKKTFTPTTTTTTTTRPRSKSSEEMNETIEFIEDMGFERPAILAAIMKLQLDEEPVINIESIIAAINDLMTPVNNESSPPRQQDTTTTTTTTTTTDDYPSIYPSLPPATLSHTEYSPPVSPRESYPAPSAPPLHTQHSDSLDSDRSKCKICYENEINTVLLPCAHRVVCILCSSPLKLCPVCRVPISQVIKTYDT